MIYRLQDDDLSVQDDGLEHESHFYVRHIYWLVLHCPAQLLVYHHLLVWGQKKSYSNFLKVQWVLLCIKRQTTEEQCIHNIYTP